MSLSKPFDARKNKATADQGETIACDRLQRQGWHILFRNWRSAPYEIDIIAIQGSLLAFVEVKSSRSQRFAEPIRQVKPGKFNNLSKAAYRYLQDNPHCGEIRFDLMECRWLGEDQVECHHWEDFWKPDNLGIHSPRLDSFWRNTGRLKSNPMQDFPASSID
jgi:putative endonuclease